MQALLEKIFSQRELNAIYDIGVFIRELFCFPGLKRAGALLLAIFEIFPMLLFATPRTPMGPALDLTGYRVVFEDNFEGSTLDLTKWEFRGTGPRAGGYMHPDQVRVENGKLILTAEHLEEGARGAGSPAGWYSGMLRTVDEFTYGYYEMTCICSQGGGFWSAWWLNAQGMSSAEASKGGVGGAEIDIFEAFCYKDKVGKDAVSLNVHVGGYGDGLRSVNLGNWRGRNIYTQNNTYGLLWTQDEYIFYINGVEAVRSAFKEGVSEVPEYAILSLALPMEITDRSYTTEFIIDSVRILQKD